MAGDKATQAELRRQVSTQTSKSPEANWGISLDRNGWRDAVYTVLNSVTFPTASRL
jgi:hypothetical protein